MAFKIRKKRRTDVRVATLKDTYLVVSMLDPAIDWENTDRELWHTTLDPGAVALVDGEQPTVFRIRALSKSEHDECFIAAGAAVDRYGGNLGGHADLRARCAIAYKLGVEEIVGLDADDELGEDDTIEVRHQIGRYILNLTTGVYDTGWTEDLGKSSWLDLQRARHTTPSSVPGLGASSAKAATDARSSSAAAASTPCASTPAEEAA